MGSLVSSWSCSIIVKDCLKFYICFLFSSSLQCDAMVEGIKTTPSMKRRMSWLLPVSIKYYAPIMTRMSWFHHEQWLAGVCAWITEISMLQPTKIISCCSSLTKCQIDGLCYVLQLQPDFYCPWRSGENNVHPVLAEHLSSDRCLSAYVTHQLLFKDAWCQYYLMCWKNLLNG